MEAAHQAGAIAIIPAVENGAAIGEDLGLLARFAQALGVAYITITHNGHNQLADSANPRRDLGDEATRHGGLSDLGRAALSEMNRLGILIDVSHLSRQSMLQAAMMSSVPVVATHSCAASLCDHPRNLDDQQLDALRDTHGLVQITAMPPFLRPRGRSDTVSVRDFVDHIDYVVKRIGSGPLRHQLGFRWRRRDQRLAGCIREREHHRRSWWRAGMGIRRLPRCGVEIFCG